MRGWVVGGLEREMEQQVYRRRSMAYKPNFAHYPQRPEESCWGRNTLLAVIVGGGGTVCKTLFPL